MAITLQLLGEKIRKYREQLTLSVEELAQHTGIPGNLLKQYEQGEQEPSGDEILVLADFFKCDFQFFISNENVAPFEQTESLYRRYGKEFSKADRRYVQDFLFLCECEELLESGLGLAERRTPFQFTKRGTFYKAHGADAAAALRRHLGYDDRSVGLDIFSDIRCLGFHVFRRKLGNSGISGMCVRHPKAGVCLLVNYSEDIFRQRFTAAHECAHGILDEEEDVVVSFVKYPKDDLVEIRANTFASRYLMPPAFLSALPAPKGWTHQNTIHWATRLKVSTEALAYALTEARLIDYEQAVRLRKVKVPADVKVDPEIGHDLSGRSLLRKKELLERGLSEHYVELCFEAYHQDLISRGRLGEMLMVDDPDLMNIAETYGRSFCYVD